MAFISFVSTLLLVAPSIAWDSNTSNTSEVIPIVAKVSDIGSETKRNDMFLKSTSKSSDDAYELAMREVLAHEDSPSGAIPQDWVTQRFDRDQVAENMEYVTCDGDSRKGSDIPLDFGGLWWMDGNPAPEDVSSFGQGVWTAGLEGCRSSQVYHYSEDEKRRGTIKDYFENEVPCRGRLNMDYFDERTWAWPESPLAPEIVIGAVKLGAFKIEFVCGGDDPDFLTICKVAVPSSAAEYVSKVFPTDYYMVRVSKTQWIRYTPTPLGLHQYYLKQIVDCSGRKVEPEWHQFNSGGWDKPEFQPDVFGQGGDTRRYVERVASSLYVRVNVAAPNCPKKVGTCSWFKGCGKSSNSLCQNGICLCAKGQCESSGSCV